MTAESKHTITFPKAVLTQVVPDGVEGPTYKTLLVLQAELNSNALSVQSYAGGGAHGHLALTLTDAAYLIEVGVAFVPPVNPPVSPVHPNNATNHLITEINRQHAVDKAIYTTYVEVNAALRAQLLLAVPDEYLEDLKSQTMGYGSVSCLALLTHLWANFGSISASELIANRESMYKAWSPPMPLENLFSQLKAAMLFSIAGNDAITEISAVHVGYIHLSKCPGFANACFAWCEKDEADKTWAAFKAYFRRADKKRKELAEAATTGSLGFHGAANAVVPAHAANQAIVAVPPPPRTESYCWTHGVMHKGGHNSANCREPKPGHQSTATKNDKMGGTTSSFVPRFRRAPNGA
jgi:hypothetical protein